MSGIFLCSISNVSSGNCSEDCGYCTQSVRHNSGVEVYKYKEIPTIIKEARALKKYGALGFCLVTSGRRLDSKKSEYIGEVASALKNENLGLHIIACCGSATLESLKYLKSKGVDSYNHNLETSQGFFKNICTTHTWEERFATCEDTLRAGLGLCSGGIFGLGEGWSDRIEFFKSLQSLSPHSSPINFFIPNPSLPIKNEPLSREEALECIAMAREYLPNARLMAAGGREVVFGEDQRDIFECGINAIVLGDYLTTKGEIPKQDLDMLNSYGLAIASECH